MGLCLFAFCQAIQIKEHGTIYLKQPYLYFLNPITIFHQEERDYYKPQGNGMNFQIIFKIKVSKYQQKKGMEAPSIENQNFA